MTVLICTSVRPSLRGELSRWMVEVDSGVFVGNAPGRVRDLLWEKVVNECGEGTAIMVHRARTEQGFAVRFHGTPDRTPADYDGLVLMRFQTKKRVSDTP